MIPSNQDCMLPPNESDSAWNIKPAAQRRIKVVLLNTCYEAFLSSHYRENPRLLHESYEAQLRALNNTFFGDSDFYSRGLMLAGLDACDLVINCAPLQKSWATLHGVPFTSYDLVAEQIRRIKPDVVYIQDMAGTPPALLSLFREQGILVVGQIACAVSPSIRFELYDIVFSSFPHYVDLFRQHGITAYYQPLAFDARVLDVLSNPKFLQRDIECSFIGGISAFHQHGGALLESLAKTTTLKIWGYGIENVPNDSAVAQRHQGEAWGRNMFDLLNRSKITINRHSEAAGNNANNMRLFEATGCGALLVTDYKDNLSQLFEIGKEIVVYRSVEECAALISYYTRFPEEAEQIARAGQKRTLRDHSYTSRMEKTAEILQRHCTYRHIVPSTSGYGPVSSDYKQAPNAISQDLLEGWKQKSVAHSQRRLVQNELRSMYRGETPTPFSIAANLLKNEIQSNDRVLEIGCSSGYYYEVLEYLLKRSLVYHGVDYSDHMIDLARHYYPRAEFEVADGAQLPMASSSFDIVISGCILIHCPNYPDHIKETCRVARDTILLHRTPVTLNNQTRVHQKQAYGVETIEFWFSEDEILHYFNVAGFVVDKRALLGSCPTKKMSEVSYLLKRRKS